MIEPNDTVFLKKRIGVLPADSRGTVLAADPAKDFYAVRFLNRKGETLSTLQVSQSEIELGEKHDEAGA